MSQNQPSAMQNLVTKLNQMGNGIGVTFGSATNIQTVWGELMNTLNIALNETQNALNAAQGEIQNLKAELAKLRTSEKV